MGSIFAACCKCCAGLCDLDAIFSYSTVKIVHIRDFRLGLIHRTIQLVILGYFLVYVLFVQKQYQATESSFGDSLTKLHGITRKKITRGDIVSWTMDDAENVVYPSTENNALFLATSIWHSPEQTVTSCYYPDTTCYSDSDCDGFDDDKQVSLNSGTCNTTNHLCSYDMWCPSEDPFDKTKNNNTERWDYEIEDFTIWVKSSIMFPSLDPNNVYSTIRKSKPVTKKQDPKFYNLFPVSDLLDKVDVSYLDIQQKGAILELTTNWHCNLNTWYHNPLDKRCKCTYSVKRLDDPNAGSGFNFRRTVEYMKDGVLYRDLWKYMGMRIVLVSKGVGYRLSIMQIILQLSSLFALLVVSTTVCDFVINYVLRRYRKAKVKETKSYLAQRKTQHDEKIEKENVESVVEEIGMLTKFAANFVDSDDDDDDDDNNKDNKDEKKKEEGEKEIKKQDLDADEKSPLLTINGTGSLGRIDEQQEENIQNLTDDASSSSDYLPSIE